MTNLDIIKRHFKDAVYSSDDCYELDCEYIISHEEGEIFFVERTFFDYDVGYVSDDGLFSGDLIECLDYVLKETGRQKTSIKDKTDYFNIVMNNNILEE